MSCSARFSLNVRVGLLAAAVAAVVQMSPTASADDTVLTWLAIRAGREHQPPVDPNAWRRTPGLVQRTYGARDANRCVEDASKYYGDDRVSPGDGLGMAHKYESVNVKGKDCISLAYVNPNDHLEGMARIAVPGREVIFFSYKSGSESSGTASIARVDLRENEPLTADEFPADLKEDGRDADLRWCKAIPNSPHVGGMQALGDYLFAGVEENNEGNARVDIFRVKDGNSLRTSTTIEFRSIRMPWGRKAHYVMVTRLANGKYFMAVNRNNDGVFSLFWADDPWAQWVHLGDQTFPALGDWSPKGERYQSANFVTECSGKLYVVALGQSLEVEGWAGPNEVFMFSVDLGWDGTGRPSISRLSRVGFFQKDHTGLGCAMRGAGAAHVTPSGRLSLYCGPRHEAEVWGHDFYFSSIRPQ